MRAKIRYVYSMFLAIAINPLITHATSNWNEHIIKYNTDIRVNADASLNVIEKIKAYVNDKDLKHGIIRQLPLVSTTSEGIQHEVQYKVLEVKLDNHTVPYTVENRDKHFYIVIGTKKALSTGYHSYELKYVAENAIGFVSGQDELYWNITGSHWSVPILNLHGKITAPKGVVIGKYQGDSATQLNVGKKFNVKQPAKNEIIFTARYLAPNTGLSIALDWPKGEIKRPPLTWQQELQHTIQRLIHLRWDQTTAMNAN